MGLRGLVSVDVAWRLIRFSILEAYLGEEIDPGIRRLLAGAVQQHASWLHHHLMTSSSSDLSENMVKASALVVAADAGRCSKRLGGGGAKVLWFYRERAGEWLGRTVRRVVTSMPTWLL